MEEMEKREELESKLIDEEEAGEVTAGTTVPASEKNETAWIFPSNFVYMGGRQIKSW